MKPQKICVENPDFPIRKIFKGIDWKLSGGTKQAGILAATFILAYDIDTVIEIGTWQGFTSHILGNALAANAGKNGLLVSVDIKEGNLNRGKQNTKDLCIVHTLITADSLHVNLDNVLRDRKAGLAFIDGAHDYEHCKNDISLCHDALKQYGIMIVHDYSKNGYPDVYRAANEYIEATKNPMFYLEENRKSTDYRTAIIQKVNRTSR